MSPHPSSAILVAILTLGTLAAPAAAQDAEQHFKGKQIRLLIGSSAGGGYDVFARTIASHWTKHIPGRPQIVPQNQPGPLSLNVANNLFNAAPKDGTVVGGVNPQIASEAILNPERARFDARQFLWIGSALREVQTLVGKADARVKTFADAFTEEMIAGGSGGATDTFPTISNAILGTKFKVVSGYPGSKEITLAMDRNEVQAVVVTWASVKATMRDQLAKKSINIVGQFGINKHKDLPTVARVLDFAKNSDDTAALMLLLATQEFGRPFIAPPGVPAPIAKALRTSFLATLADPEFIAEATQRGLEIDPTSGEEIDTLIAKLYETPTPVVERVRAVFAKSR